MITAHTPTPSKHTTRGIYDFAILGGAVDDIGLGVNLPVNAIVTRTWYDVLVAPASDDAALIAIGIPADDVTGIVGSTPFDNPAFAVGYHEAIQDGGAANFSEKTTANREVTLKIMGHPLTAGKIALFAEYVTSEVTPP